MNIPVAPVLLISLALANLSPTPGQAQEEKHDDNRAEVLQLVTFSFRPGKMSEAIAVFRERALPLYDQDAAMLSFRGLREVESPEPLDLIVISRFRGMAGMDESNEALRTVSAPAPSGSAGSPESSSEDSPTLGIGAFYGAIVPLIASHHDQFVELFPGLANGDPTSKRLVALVSYQLLPGEGPAFESALERAILPWERAAGVSSSTGRFLISDGWHYLRILGFDSLGDFQDYWSRLNTEADYSVIDGITTRRKEIVVAAVPELSVR
jgi:hypothetical protein